MTIGIALHNETSEKEVQDDSCRGSGGVPQHKKVPQDWGIRGLIEKSSNDDAPALIYMNKITA